MCVCVCVCVCVCLPSPSPPFTGTVLSHPHTVAIFAAHEKKVLSLFESLSDVALGSSGGGGVRLRRILLQLKVSVR